MQVTVKQNGKAVVICLGGHLDHNSAVEIQRVFDDWLGKGCRNFIIDMADLQYVSSAGLRFFFEADTRIKNLKGKLILCGMQAEVQQVFDVSGFTSFFSSGATIKNALEQI